jgi:hypothetical protein
MVPPVELHHGVLGLPRSPTNSCAEPPTTPWMELSEWTCMRGNGTEAGGGKIKDNGLIFVLSAVVS